MQILKTEKFRVNLQDFHLRSDNLTYLKLRDNPTSVDPSRWGLSPTFLIPAAEPQIFRDAVAFEHDGSERLSREGEDVSKFSFIGDISKKLEHEKLNLSSRCPVSMGLVNESVRTQGDSPGSNMVVNPEGQESLSDIPRPERGK